MSIEQKLTGRFSTILDERIPEFIRHDHPQVVEFLRAYYQWLETSDQVHELMFSIKEILDVDKTEAEFLELFHTEFLQGLPQNMAMDKARLIQESKELYLSKGSEAAHKFFFRALFDEAITVYYPKEDILRTSDGIWLDNICSIKIAFLEGDDETGYNLINRDIRQITMGDVSWSAKMTSVLRYHEGENDVLELFLENVTGTYVEGQTVYTTFEGDATYPLTLLKGIVGVDITEGGSSYEMGDPISFEASAYDPNGVGGEAVVCQTSRGAIESLTIQTAGSGYAAGDKLQFVNADDCDCGLGANATVSNVNGSGAITELKLAKGGYNYREIPTINVISEDGSGAIIYASGSEIGAVESIEMVKHGSGYTIAPEAVFETKTGADTTAEGTAILGTVFKYPARWADESGFLNVKVLQDSYFYQEFSYALKSERSASEYEDFIKNVMHPAGLKFFPLLSWLEVMDWSVDIDGFYTSADSEQIWGDYEQYVSEATTNNLGQELQYLNLYAEHFDDFPAIEGEISPPTDDVFDTVYPDDFDLNPSDPQADIDAEPNKAVNYHWNTNTVNLQDNADRLHWTIQFGDYFTRDFA